MPAHWLCELLFPRYTGLFPRDRPLLLLLSCLRERWESRAKQCFPGLPGPLSLTTSLPKFSLPRFFALSSRMYRSVSQPVSQGPGIETVADACSMRTKLLPADGGRLCFS